MEYIVESERLGLRKLTEADFDVICVFLKDPEVMYAWGHGFSDEEVRKWLGKNLKRYDKDGYGFFLAIEKQTGDPVGVIGIIHNEINGRQRWEIGYIIDKRHWRRGFAREGSKACLKHAFSTMGLEEMVFQMRTDNIPSQKVAQSLGAQREGEYIRHYWGEDMPHYICVVKKDAFC